MKPDQERVLLDDLAEVLAGVLVDDLDLLARVLEFYDSPDWCADGLASLLEGK